VTTNEPKDPPGGNAVSIVCRLDYTAHRLVVHRDSARQAVEAVTIRRRCEVIDELALIGDQAHIDLPATQIQPNMQHHTLPSPSKQRAGSAQPTAYRDDGRSSVVRMAGRADSAARA
jgi:hypothetical protein